MALLDAYCTVAYADTVNASSTTWTAAATADKEDALTKGRYFIDANYSCVDISDYDDVPDEFQTSNAQLALVYLGGTLFSQDTTGSQAVVKKKVKAGEVEVDTTYSGFMKANVTTGDKYPEVTALLSPYCSLGTSTSLTRV